MHGLNKQYLQEDEYGARNLNSLLWFSKRKMKLIKKVVSADIFT